MILSTPSHTEYASWKRPPQFEQLPIDSTYFGSGICSYRTLVRRAIFSVSVPATIIRSETRGVARGAMPKRSRSARGPPVCIISMAQHARPNSMYQSEDLRVQLRSSSTFVVSTISGTVLSSDIDPFSRRHASGLWRRRSRNDFLHPVQIALAPHIDEAEDQDRNEQHDLEQCEQSLAF